MARERVMATFAAARRATMAVSGLEYGPDRA